MTDGSIIWKCDLSDIPYESLFNLPYFNGHFYAETTGGKYGSSRLLLIRACGNRRLIVVSPQCPEGQWWQPVELTALLDEIVEKYKVDEDRIYVTGLSMGGVWHVGVGGIRPAPFGSIAPIRGGGGELPAAKRRREAP